MAGASWVGELPRRVAGRRGRRPWPRGMAGASLRRNVANVLVIGTGAAGLRAAIAAHQAGSEVVVVGKRAATTPTRSSPPAGSTPPWAPSTPRIPGSSTSPTPCARATSCPTPASSSSWPRGPRGDQELADWGRPSPAPPMAGWTSGSSAPTGTGGPATPATAPAGRSCAPSPPRWPSSASPWSTTSTSPSCWSPTGRCFGALAFDLQSGERTVYLADASSWPPAVTLACGAAAPPARDENTGDGMYLALEAGCRLPDMELVQFHPTGMVAPEEWAGTW